jgi:3',5'-cyclic AMP phosphodiesterase CpdA
VIVAQITDLHVVEPGHMLSGVVDTSVRLQATVAHLNRLDPRPDVVLATGDLVDGGLRDQYKILHDLLEPLDVPYWVIPGNHDRRDSLLDVLGEHAGVNADGFVQYTVDVGDVRLVALDTLHEGAEEGRLCDERLTWLDAELAAARDRPTLVFMHHPPFETGVWWMDSAGLSGREALRAILEQHPQVELVVCGHVHRPIQTLWARTRVAVCASTAYQVTLDLRAESRPSVVLEPPLCALHVHDGRGFVSHASYVDWPESPIDISSLMGDWDQVRETMRARRARLT